MIGVLCTIMVIQKDRQPTTAREIVFLWAVQNILADLYLLDF